ncbi:ABC transporter substrate-binding protein [Pendulispora albinea]|uniref:ABC transporter substrate-binding protein n=1 Tax=Pendulispora albinea TaxID=2741071 RepID=A0ABZ2MC70_9BACT
MKTRTSLFRAGGLLLLAIVGPALALDTTACSKESVPPSSQEPIKIGFSVALSGGYSGTGTGLLQGAQVAVDLVNARGGVLGRPIQLLVEDDQSSNPTIDQSRRLTQVIKGFVDQKVAAILGPGATVQVRTAADITFPRDPSTRQLVKGATPTLLITPWATSPTLTNDWNPWPERYLYRTPPSDKYQRAALYKRMKDPIPTGGDSGPGEPPCKQQPFLVYANDALGSTYEQYFSAQPGADAKYKVAVPTDDKGDGNYTEVIAAYRAAPPPAPDCVALVTYAEVSGNVVRQFRQAVPAINPMPKFFGTDAIFDPGFVTTVRNNAWVEGISGVEPDTAPLTNDYQDFKNIFQAQTATSGGALVEPPPYSSNAFDAVILLAFAIQKAETATDPKKIRDAMVEVSRGYPADLTEPPAELGAKLVSPRNIDLGFATLANKTAINYEGASGKVNFDRNGDVVAGYVKWFIKDGQFQLQDGAGSRYTAEELERAQPK